MDPIEARLMRLWARLAAENAALTALLADGYAPREAEEILWEKARVAAEGRAALPSAPAHLGARLSFTSTRDTITPALGHFSAAPSA